jgi:thiol-disulfide isomerase/thioredoxin
MKRRRILAAGLGVALVSTGLGWALRRYAEQAPGDEGAAGPGRTLDPWSLRFEAPGGGEVSLAALRGRPLLVNFWATWCPPCIEEMPLLDRFQREHQGSGWQVLGLAVDGAEPVREFLSRHPVGFRIGLAAAQGVALSRSLGNTGGALPFSVAFDSRGEAVERKLGVLKWGELTTWAERVR